MAGGVRQLVVWHPAAVASLNPETGALYWEEPFRIQAGLTVATPVLSEHGLLVMFICNHCPYVKAVRKRLVRDAQELQQHGVGSVAIMSNDTENYPEDSFDNMQRIARDWQLPFPYLLDATQEVARAYGAVCTPDFFGYNADGELQYRGRLDQGRLEEPPPGTRRDLFEAMCQVATTGKGPEQQQVSAGCSIKWRA